MPISPTPQLKAGMFGARGVAAQPGGGLKKPPAPRGPFEQITEHRDHHGNVVSRNGQDMGESRGVESIQDLLGDGPALPHEDTGDKGRRGFCKKFVDALFPYA